MIDERKLISFCEKCFLEYKEEWNKHDTHAALGAMCAYDAVIDRINELFKDGSMIDAEELVNKIKQAIDDDRYVGYNPARILCEVIDMIRELQHMEEIKQYR